MTAVWIVRDTDPKGGFLSLHLREPDVFNLHLSAVETRTVNVSDEFIAIFSAGEAAPPFSPVSGYDEWLSLAFSSGAVTWTPSEGPSYFERRFAVISQGEPPIPPNEQEVI